MAESLSTDLKVGDVYPDYTGQSWFVYGWPTSDRAFTTQQDAQRAWALADEHAREKVEELADKIKDVMP